MRIIHVTAPAPAGGLERVVRGLTLALRSRGHDVAVIASIGTDEAPHPFVAALLEDGVDVHSVRVGRRAYRAELAGIDQALRAAAPDVIHSHGFRSDVLALIAARRRSRPIVSTVHGMTGGGPGVRLYETIQMFALRRFDAVVPVARPLADRLARSGVPRDRMHVIRNALPVGPRPLDRAAARTVLGLPLDAPVIGWVGRFGAEKRPGLFVDALARSGSDVYGIMIGDGPQHAPTIDRARAAGLGERMCFPGRVDAADRYLSAFDAVVLSSRTEGTPIILLEAMGAGVPAISTAVGGVPDVVGPDEALLVPPESPDALAAAIRDVIDRPAAAAARAQRARTRLATEFSVDAWVTAYLDLYRSIQHGRRR